MNIEDDMEIVSITENNKFVAHMHTLKPAVLTADLDEIASLLTNDSCAKIMEVCARIFGAQLCSL